MKERQYKPSSLHCHGLLKLKQTLRGLGLGHAVKLLTHQKSLVLITPQRVASLLEHYRHLPNERNNDAKFRSLRLTNHRRKHSWMCTKEYKWQARIRKPSRLGITILDTSRDRFKALLV